MSEQPRGRPPSQPPPQRGQRALTFLGGGVLVLAVAGGAWALFGRDQQDDETTAIGPKVPASASANTVFGPAVPGAKSTPSVSPTSIGPVAATPSKAAATPSPKPSPTQAPVATKPPAASPAPVSPPAPAVTGPQQSGTVAVRDYTFKVARGDTLWDMTKEALSRTGRSTSNANVAAYVQKLYQHNAATVGSDPDLIFVGQTIVWPQGL